MTDDLYNNDDMLPKPASVAFAENAAPVPALPAFDAAKYRTHLASLALTDEQERELLETLWSIMYSFVELGFRVDVCSALFDEPEIVAGDDSGIVRSEDPQSSETTSNTIAEEGPA